MRKIKIKLASLFIVAIIAINFTVTVNRPNSFQEISLDFLKQASANLSECGIIITPGGGGTEGAALAEGFCDSPIILIMWAECVWTGNCDDICMFEDEKDCP